MKLKFNPNQEYQLEAIQSIVDVFKGQPMARTEFELSGSMGSLGLQTNEMGFGNKLVISDKEILSNIKEIQGKNNTPQTLKNFCFSPLNKKDRCWEYYNPSPVFVDAANEDEAWEILQNDIKRNIVATKHEAGKDVITSPWRKNNGAVSCKENWHFSVEMETGTGKTYVYLRTVFELYKSYGFTKFIIVVPSIAIREGVKNAIDLTKEHFRTLYDNVPINAWVYDSKYVSRLREYASSNQIQILIMNIDSFKKKDINIIHGERDQTNGRKPIDFIKSCHPIVIVDEPQNMESELAKEAIGGLNPLCTLRYSATHKSPYNLLYRLGPVKAYDMGLVKRIEVASVMEDSNFNKPHISVQSVRNTGKKTITAKVEIDVETNKGTTRKVVSIKDNGTDLYELSGGRENYRGYVIDELHSGDEYIKFTNGIRLYVGQEHGTNTDKRMKLQIRETIKEHFEKELKMLRLPEEERMKVLSLFFIDKVANYRDENGTIGKIQKWFIDIYNEISSQPDYQSLKPLEVNSVHNGYFAQDKKGMLKDTSGTTKADDDAYELIMKDKTRLLSIEEPLKFIFSHSALREGWDNPNVFQICTLNETRSELKKRQEIGRGLRLPVRADGERCFDRTINRLTVIANESYDDFAKKLQVEIKEETGEDFGERIQNKAKKRKINLKKGWKLNEDFKNIWDKIKHRTRYAVKYDTPELIKIASKAVSEIPAVSSPQFELMKGEIEITEKGLTTEMRSRSVKKTEYKPDYIPNILKYLQDKTELPRLVLSEILLGSGRLSDIRKNPQEFLEFCADAINRVLRNMMVDGIEYEKIAGFEYEMRLFEDEEMESYIDRMIDVNNSIYDAIEYDSDTEKYFAEELDKRNDIKLFIKLPGWFKVITPLGTYNPDWAIVKQEDKKLYLVRETKGSSDESSLRETEKLKISCGHRHFEELDVNFAVVKEAKEV